MIAAEQAANFIVGERECGAEALSLSAHCVTVEADADCAAEIRVTSSRGGVPFRVRSSAPWVSVEPEHGFTPARLRIRAESAGLAPGHHPSSLTLSCPDAGVEVSLPVIVKVGPLTCIETRPAHLSYYVDEKCHWGDEAFLWNAGQAHQLSVPALQTESSGSTRHRFVAWSDGGAPVHTIEGRRASQQIVGVFSTEHRLEFESTPGGTVRVSPESPDGFYPDGMLVDLRAEPEAGFRFAGYSGGFEGNTAAVELALEEPTKIRAIFEPV